MCHRRVTFALTALASTFMLAACGNGGGNSTTGTTTTAAGGAGGQGTGGSGGAPTVTSYTPEGCSFSIATRAEYQGFSIPKPSNGATPNIRRVRLGLGGNVDVGAAGHADPATSIGVAWQTDEDTLSSEISWGTDPDPSKWSAANRAGGVTWITPALTSTLANERMHEVYLCGLTPATTYYYRVGGGPAGKEVWSEVYSFTTTPKAGPTKITIGVTGDSRGEGQDAWRMAQRRMNALSPTLQLFSGDMVNIAIDQSAWESWLDKAWRDDDDKPLTLSRILTLHTHGNHENHTTFFFGNLAMPQDNVKFPKYGELFYSVDVGPAHIVVIDDAWVVSTSGDPEYAGVIGAWLDADLDAANKNRATVPWIITMHHHGEFSSSTHGTDSDVLRGRQFFVPIWDKYHVDLDVVGHDHNYERSKPLTGPLSSPDLMPVVKSTPADGTVYVICAGVGAPAYTSGTSAWTEVSHDFTSGGAIGVYGLITADATSLKFDAHELRADASDPVFDTFTITKP
ncbi:MAG: fibronectin type III domain-containing protein [Minicystis sp.]